MQFQLSPTPSQRRIRRIPTIRLQTMKHVRGNCMRNCWGGGAWPGFETTRRAKLAARTARGRAATHRHRGRSLWRPSRRWCLRRRVVSASLPVPLHPGACTLIAESTINYACNSLTALSNHEFRLLELQRFQTLLTLLPIELHATFLRPGSVVTFELRSQALRLEVRSVPPVSATPGVLPGGVA